MYLPGKFVKSGTSATSDPPFVAAAATTYVLDMNQPNPAWRQTAPMTFPRAYHNMVLLPDGTVLTVGGGRVTSPFDQSQSVFAAELWSPTTQTWATTAGMLQRCSMWPLPCLVASAASTISTLAAAALSSGRSAITVPHPCSTFRIS